MRAAASATNSTGDAARLRIERRKAQMMKRGGIDPMRADRRPLNIVMNDEIPYERFENQYRRLRRTGYDGWEQYLKARAKGDV